MYFIIYMSYNKKIRHVFLRCFIFIKLIISKCYIILRYSLLELYFITESQKFTIVVRNQIGKKLEKIMRGYTKEPIKSHVRMWNNVPGGMESF